MERIRRKKVQLKFKPWKLLLFLAVATVLAVGANLFYIDVYKVAPVFQEMTYEYGEQVSRDIEDYLAGSRWSVHLGELDLSQVNEDQPGSYVAVVRHGRTEYAYILNIQDTMAPEIIWKKGTVYLPVDTVCTVEDVIAGVEDADPLTEVFFLWQGGRTSQLRFEQVGEYEVWLLARDRVGNETGGTVRVKVDTPPTITGIRNLYVATGSTPDYLASVKARDDVDGDLTQYIEVDDSQVELDREGEYALWYSAEDSYGLETVEETTVLVADAEEIQEMIGSRLINCREDVIFGAPNPYDSGASAYENLAENMKYVLPALVQLYHGTGGGGYSAGSGYIVEITEDTVYICTNRHVVEKDENWDVYFYDGTKVPGRRVGVSDTYDVGVAAVTRTDIPEKLFRQLMTVHIDRTYWETLDTQKIAMALERVDREGGLVHMTTGNLIKVRQEFDWYEKLYHTEVTVELVQGDSGSALLDGYGNLICMAYAYSTAPVRYWCIPLDAILDCYEEITGRALYVY